MKIRIEKNTISLFLEIFLRYLRRLQLSPSGHMLWFIIVIICIFSIQGHFSQAQTKYVDACAAGPGSGTESDPYSKLSNAVAAVAPGGNISIMGGLYPETLKIQTALKIHATEGPALIGTGKYRVSWRDIVLDVGSNKFTNARIYYPSYRTGPNAKIATSCTGKFPAVAYAHGLRLPGQADLADWCDDELRTDFTKDYLQAEGILKQLVSSGIIAISFDWLSLTVHDNEIVDYVMKALLQLGNEFGAKADLQNAGLIGHSTGGAAVILAAEKFKNMENPPAQINGVGLIAPAFPLHQELINLTNNVLVIHGTRDHPNQVGTTPLKVYCKAKGNKHLLVIEGANHFGYTDGICLDPNQHREARGWYDPWGLLPEADGYDNACMVGGLEGKEAQVLQRRTAGNYLLAFFRKYLHKDNNVNDYLVQQSGNNCGHPDDEQLCDTKRLDVYMWQPNSTENLCPQFEIEISHEVIENLIAVPKVLDTFRKKQGANTGNWEHLGVYDFTRTGVVRIISPGGCSVIADAVSFAPPGTQPSAGFIVDNNSNEGWIRKYGTWITSTKGSKWYDDDYLISSEAGASFSFFTRFSMELDASGCEPKRYFNDLSSLNVKVSVCSCIK